MPFKDLPEGQTYKKIPLGGLKGSGKYIFIDTKDFELVEKYKWSETIDDHLRRQGYNAAKAEIRNNILKQFEV